MKKVENLNGYQFDSLTYIKFTKERAFGKIDILKKLLDKKIESMESHLNELKELKSFMQLDKQIYLFKTNDSDYGYVDSYGDNYEFQKINDKPILIDSNFNLFEIVEYVDVSDIGQDKGNRNVTMSWIDKVVKVKKVVGNQN